METSIDGFRWAKIQVVGNHRWNRMVAQGPSLTAEAVGLELGDFEIDDLSLALPEGQITGVIGPNGSGKTTLLRLMSRLLEPDCGAVYLHGHAIAELSTREVARELAILPQSSTPPEGVTVRELVAYGRHPHNGLLDTTSEDDEETIQWALDATNLDAMADRHVDSLSGGERQRAWIAMALAQDTAVLLLDEPTNHLDVRYQVETLSLVRELNREHGITVGWVLHDLNQAAAYSDRLALMQDGSIAAQGPADETLQADTLEAVFGIPMTVTEHPTAGTPFVIPLDPEHDTTEVERVQAPGVPR
jgi:iron complex transport system ATP-binding protein